VPKRPYKPRSTANGKPTDVTNYTRKRSGATGKNKPIRHRRRPRSGPNRKEQHQATKQIASAVAGFLALSLSDPVATPPKNPFGCLIFPTPQSSTNTTCPPQLPSPKKLDLSSALLTSQMTGSFSSTLYWTVRAFKRRELLRQTRASNN